MGACREWGSDKVDFSSLATTFMSRISFLKKIAYKPRKNRLLRRKTLRKSDCKSKNRVKRARNGGLNTYLYVKKFGFSSLYELFLCFQVCFRVI